MPSNIEVLQKLMEGPADIEVILETLKQAKEVVDAAEASEENSRFNEQSMLEYFDSLPRKLKRKVVGNKNSFSNRFKATINKK